MYVFQPTEDLIQEILHPNGEVFSFSQTNLDTIMHYKLNGNTPSVIHKWGAEMHYNLSSTICTITITGVHEKQKIKSNRKSNQTDIIIVGLFWFPIIIN